MLIAYFSWGGTVRYIAGELSGILGCHAFEIVAAKPYPKDYDACLVAAKRDLKEKALPAIEGRVEDMDGHRTIILAYPNWWSSVPRPVATFLGGYDFSGKGILPLCSHGGGGLGQSVADIGRLAPGAKVLKPLGVGVGASGGKTLRADLEEWLRRNGVERPKA
jgi:flavodoxin